MTDMTDEKWKAFLERCRRNPKETEAVLRAIEEYKKLPEEKRRALEEAARKQRDEKAKKEPPLPEFP
jgi:hypothetical protein